MVAIYRAAAPSVRCRGAACGGLHWLGDCDRCLEGELAPRSSATISRVEIPVDLLHLSQRACESSVYSHYDDCAPCQGRHLPPPRTWRARRPCPSTKPDASSIPSFMLAGLRLAFSDWLGGSSAFAAPSPRADTQWSLVQVVTPIVVGLTVALLALALFLWYRRRRRPRDPVPHRRWVDAQLHAPRRFFGLLPSTRSVRPAPRRPSNWSIDDDEGGTYLHAHAGPSSATASLRSMDSAHSHTRTGSSASLLPRVTFALAPLLGVLSRSKDGMRKSPEYKAATVRAKRPDTRFKIDESQPPTRAGTLEGPLADAPRAELGTAQGVASDPAGGGPPLVQAQNLHARQGSDDDECSVLLISRVPGENFALESVEGVSTVSHARNP
ncbi:hypothetical protein B0H21DRAFT_166954 [Amylocystis lapponica]|nr:hypothetical protein B0H21DRAFT_166954 [Amylocystis lapponica]